MTEYMAFTVRGEGYMDKLLSNVVVLSDIRDAAKPFLPKLWVALWDTGATRTCISSEIVKDLNLIPIGSSTMSTANGLKETHTYRIDVLLPNQVMVKQIIASEADFGPDFHVLLGMDIIRHGDFSITNFNQQTVFSFRMPSMGDVDFVKQYNEEKAFEELAIQEAAANENDMQKDFMNIKEDPEI